MNTLRKWAEYYHDKWFAVYPSNADRFNLRYPTRQPLHAVQDFNWEDSDWIAGLAGVSDVAVVRLDFTEQFSDYIFRVITRFMYHLGLHHYPWILYQENTASIIILCKHPKDHYSREGWEPISIIWQGAFKLPFDTNTKHSNVKFFFDALPNSKPRMIAYKDLMEAINKLIEDFGLGFYKEKEDTP